MTNVRGGGFPGRSGGADADDAGAGGAGGAAGAGGAGRAGAGGAGRAARPRRRVEVEHRGVRWRKSVAGTIAWLNEGMGRWVTWYPGADAPPLPPGWEPSPDDLSPAALAAAQAAAAQAAAGQAAASQVARPAVDMPVPRHRMLSPYRLVPLVIAVIAVGLAIWQAAQPAQKASPADIAAAQSLKGQCLSRTGGPVAKPQFSALPVSCSDKSASVKVVAVVVPGLKTGPKECPVGAGVVQVLQPGVTDEPWECTEPVKHHR